MLAHELGDRWGDVTLSKENGGGHTNFALGLGIRRCDSERGLVDVRQNPPAPIDVDPAFLCERHLASGSNQKTNAQKFLEGRQRSDHRGWSAIEDRRGGRKTSGVIDRNEGLHVGEEIHAGSIVSKADRSCHMGGIYPSYGSP